MDDRPYMDGEGIKDRTRELCDDMWDTLGGAILGTSLAVIAAPGGILIAIFGASNWTASTIAVGVGFSIAALGCWIAAPWFRAQSALQAHRRQMNHETNKRGHGRAKS